MDKPSKDRFDAQLQEIAAQRSAFERTITALGIDAAVRRLARSESHLEIGALVMEVLTKSLPEPHEGSRRNKAFSVDSRAV